MSPLLFLAIALVVPILGMLVLGIGARMKLQRVSDDEIEPFRRQLANLAPKSSDDKPAGTPGIWGKIRPGNSSTPLDGAAGATATVAGAAAAGAAAVDDADTPPTPQAGRAAPKQARKAKSRRLSRRVSQPAGADVDAELAAAAAAPASIRLIERGSFPPPLRPFSLEAEEPLEAPPARVKRRPADGGRVSAGARPGAPPRASTSARSSSGSSSSGRLSSARSSSGSSSSGRLSSDPSSSGSCRLIGCRLAVRRLPVRRLDSRHPAVRRAARPIPAAAQIGDPLTGRRRQATFGAGRLRARLAIGLATVMIGAVNEQIVILSGAVLSGVILNAASRVMDRQDVFRDSRQRLIGHALDGRRRPIRGKAIGSGATRERGRQHRQT